jgi:hypothetical protein
MLPGGISEANGMQVLIQTGPAAHGALQRQYQQMISYPTTESVSEPTISCGFS